jgi:hypothetical protein
MIKSIKLSFFVGLIAGFTFSTFAVTYTVSKDGSGQYTTIMAAIKAAGPGDVVQILDVATYPEQVTIDSTKNGLTLTSKNPTDINKPRIVWRDTVNVGPRDSLDAKVDSLWTSQKNGAVRCIAVREVTINGLYIDGDRPFCFGANAILEGRYPIQHGNSCIAIWRSGAICVKNSSIANAYFGMYILDGNQGGIYGNPNPADNEPWKVTPLSGFGKTGNHIFEHNRIHHNSYGLFFEAAWDLGSTIRYNLIYENHHCSNAFAIEVKGKTSEGNNQPGGALFFRDVILTRSLFITTPSGIISWN